MNQGVTILSSAHQTVSLPSGFVDALVTIPAMFLFHHQNIGPTHTHLPVSLWDFCDRRLEAVGVESLITAVTEQQCTLVLSAVTKLTRGLHDGLVPGDGRLQDVEGHGQLGCVTGVLHRLPPSN